MKCSDCSLVPEALFYSFGKGLSFSMPSILKTRIAAD